MIGKTVSHYKILEELGGGGMGVVYRAEDTRLKRIVALKFLSPELTRDERAKRRFVTEAQAASRLDHPNICTIHEIEETDDEQLFLVLSCYEGETVKDRLDKGPMPVDEAVGLAVHVARGLEAAHAKGIVHRDIKSANIFLTNDNRAKILDFGLAKLAGQTKMTRVGSTIGTVAYMSPEQARGGDVQAATDIWSLGVVLYEALTGNLPFPGERPESVLYSVVHEEPPPVAELRHDVPPVLAAIVGRCLKKDPAERFGSATELAAALEPLRGRRTSGSSLIEIGSTTRIPAEPRHVNRLLVVAVALVLACAGVFALPQGRAAVRNLFGSRELPQFRQVAVLPFSNAGDESDAAFVDGLGWHLTSRLTRLEQLDSDFRVIPAEELGRHEVETVAEALDVLGATLALSGTVERSGDRVGVDLELIDTRSRRVLKTWRGEDDLANIAAIQLDPITATANMLELALRAGDRRRLAAGGTTVPGAFRVYVNGMGRLLEEDTEAGDNVTDAIALLEEATELDPSYADAQAELARACWKAFVATGDREHSRTAGERAQLATRLEAGLSGAYATLGFMETQAEHYSEAVRQFRSALEADPVDPRARRGLALASEKAGDHALAEITYKEAIDLRRRHWATHYYLGRYYYYQDRYDDALRVLGEASALAPDNAWPYIIIGAIYYDTDRLDEAWTMWGRSAELAPTREAYSNLGTSYFAESRYADAARMYEAAIELDDSYYITWGNLAAVCGVVPGKEERAAQCYARALELAAEELRVEPGDAGILASMASYSAELGDTARAMSFLGRTIELGDHDSHTMFEIGLTYEVLGNREAALEWIDRSVEGGFSRKQVESTPSLREFCTDQGYRRLVQRGSGR